MKKIKMKRRKKMRKKEVTQMRKPRVKRKVLAVNI